MLVGGSVIIAFSILYVLTALTVEENTYAISLLKVLGYRPREVNGMILDSYLIYALFAYAVSLPIALLIMHGIMTLFIQEYGILMALEFNLWQALWGVAFVVGLYLLGTWHSRHVIGRISLQEVLKAYRE